MKSSTMFVATITTAVLLAGSTLSSAASAREESVKRLHAATEVLQQIMDAPIKGSRKK